MRVMTALGTVHPDHTMAVKVPDDVPLGTQTVFLEFPDIEAAPRTELRLNLRSLGFVDPNCTFRREEIYGEDGRSMSSNRLPNGVRPRHADFRFDGTGRDIRHERPRSDGMSRWSARHWRFRPLRPNGGVL